MQGSMPILLDRRLDTLENRFGVLATLASETSKRATEIQNVLTKLHYGVRANFNAIRDNREAILGNRKAILENRKAIDEINSKFDRGLKHLEIGT